MSLTRAPEALERRPEAAAVRLPPGMPALPSAIGNRAFAAIVQRRRDPSGPAGATGGRVPSMSMPLLGPLSDPLAGAPSVPLPSGAGPVDEPIAGVDGEPHALEESLSQSPEDELTASGEESPGAPADASARDSSPDGAEKECACGGECAECGGGGSQDRQEAKRSLARALVVEARPAVATNAPAPATAKECACGGECDECRARHDHAPGGSERSAARSALHPARRTLQRGILDDAAGAVSSVASSAASAAGRAAEAVLPEGLLQGVRGLVRSGEDQVGEIQGLPDRATEAESEVRESGRQVREQGDEAARDGQEQGEQHDAETRQVAEEGRGRGQEMQGQASAAAGQMEGLPSIVGPALDPGGLISDAPAVRQVGQRIAAVAQALPGAQEVGGDIAGDVQEGLAAGPTAGWDCTASEVMSMVSNVGRTLGGYAERGGRALLGDEGYERVMRFADGVATRVRNTAAAIRRRVSSAVDAVTGWWGRNVQPVIEGVQRRWEAVKGAWERLKTGIRERLSGLWGRATQIFESVKTRVAGFIERKVDQVRTFVSGVVDRARGLVGRLWDAVPGPLKGVITGLGAAAVGPIGLAAAAGQRLAQFVMSHREEITGALRSAGDKVVGWIGEKYRAGKELVTSAVEAVRSAGREIGAAVRSKAQQVYGAVDDATGGWLTKIRQASSQVGAQLRENACALLGTAAGPCIRNALPRTGDFVEAAVSGDVTIPVEGVPVKVAAGAKVNVAREGSDQSPQYSATLSGEGSLGVELALSGGGGGGGAGGGSSVGVKVDLPAGGRADVSDLWRRLTGGGGAAGASPAGGTTAAPAPGPGATGQTPAPAGGATTATPAPRGGATTATPAPQGGARTGTAAPAPGATSTTPAPGQQQGQAPAAAAGGPEAKLGAGYKGAVEAKYQFSGAGADEASCRGLGGLTAMLAACGAGGALSQLPPPFSMVGAAAGGAGSGAFADNLVSLKMTLSQFGGITVDLKQDGVGALNIAGNMERGVSLGMARQLQDDPATKENEAGWVQSATLFQSLSGSVGGSLASGPISGIGGSLGGGGRMALTLQYRPATDKIEAVNAEVSANASVSLNNVNSLIAVLPPEVATPLRSAVQPYLQGQGQASVDGSIKYTAKLLPLITALDACLSNPATCTVDAVWAAVSRFFATADNFTREIEVSLTARTRLAGIGVEASQQGQGGQVGVNVSVSLDAGHTCKLYPQNECLSRLRPAAPAAA